VTIEKPSSWLLILYDVPSEPSRLKVRLWRDLKRMGALYPQLSVCLIPDNNDNRKKLETVEKMAAKSGRFMNFQCRRISENDQQSILRMFRTERDKQYNEILEECQEFIDEIKSNVDNKKTVQEEVEEMEEVLDGLRRWLDRIKSIDWVEKPAASTRVEKLLERCQDLMDKFTELSHPEKSNLGKKSN
jgi:DNA-binding transcriptional regulator PaaX